MLDVIMAKADSLTQAADPNCPCTTINDPEGCGVSSGVLGVSRECFSDQDNGISMATFVI